jgi:hypothetical protein
MKTTQSYSSVMNITTDIVTDPHHLSCVGSLVGCQNFHHVIISHDIGDIPFPIRTNYLTLSYNVKTKDQLLNLRRKLTNIQAHTIIINNDTNLIHYLRENTFVQGSGLFGAIIRNEYVHKLIIQYNIPSIGSGSDTEKYHTHGDELKHNLKKEQHTYRRGIIVPLKKVKIRVYYD